MEGIQVLNYCQWISKKINLKDYFTEYKNVLKEANGNKDHYNTVDENNAIKEFFYAPEEDSYGIRRVGSYLRSAASSTADGRDSSEMQCGTSGIKDTCFVDVKNPKCQIGNSTENTDRPASENDIYLGHLENCANLLTVDGELPQKDSSQIPNFGSAGRCTNWFTGSFMDGIIPDGASENLSTLVSQTRELYKRETEKCYIRTRHRHLKYASTVRMIVKGDNVPEVVSVDNNLRDKCLNEIICNVRIQRPYHKNTFQRKGRNEYPKYSEEFLLLGSQCLTELRDIILCVNDHYCHQEMSQNPDLNLISNLDTMEDHFPSSIFYIDGVFYIDKRNPTALDISERVRTWAKSVPNYNPITVKDMNSSKFNDLQIHLGYPYLYQHLGNCEHLITFTDVRLHHRRDIQDPAKYPLLRGNPIKMSFKCFACKLYLANWVVKDSPLLSSPFTHFCDPCLKMMFYDDDNIKIGEFKLYPFMDEFAAKKRKNDIVKRKPGNVFKQIVIDGWKTDGSSKFTFT